MINVLIGMYLTTCYTPTLKGAKLVSDLKDTVILQLIISDWTLNTNDLRLATQD